MENCGLVFERSTIQVEVAGKIDSVKNPLEAKGFADRLTEHKETIDTVKHAAQRIGYSEAEIAKTLSIIVDEKPVIVVIAGDGRVNPSEFKAVFHTKPSMIQREQIEAITGFASSGVCPFNVPKEIPVWLDVSMKRFEYVHPADGNKVSGGFLFEIHFLLENSGAHSTCE